MKLSYLVPIMFLTLVGCGSNELESMGKYQDRQDMNRLKYYQEQHDEKVRKDLKNEHKADIVFNLSVTKEQIEIDEKKFAMLDKFHLDGNEHITRDELEYYNKWLNKDRARLENEDGIARPDDVPEDSPPNNPVSDADYKEDRREVKSPEENKSEEDNNAAQTVTTPEPPKEEYSVQHYTVPASDGLPANGINAGRSIKENGVE